MAQDAGIGPDPRITHPRAAQLSVKLRPDLGPDALECWVAYRPDLDDDPEQLQHILSECAQRIDSLVNDGPNGPYTWEQHDGFFIVSLVERGWIHEDGTIELS